MRVIVSGRLRQRSYETKEGEKRTVVELDVEEIGPSLKYATAKVTKANRDRPGSSGWGQDHAGSDRHIGAGHRGDDPWATTAAGWGSQDQPPPF